MQKVLEFDDCVHGMLLYANDAEQRAVSADFVRQGLKRNQGVVYVADRSGKRALHQLAVELRGNIPSSSGLLQVLSSFDVYLIGRVFDPERTCAKWKELVRDIVAEGFSEVRLTGEMGWALRGFPHSERLLEYEAAVVGALKELPIKALCQYDMRRFPSECISAIMDAHPHVVLKGKLHAIKQHFFRQEEVKINGLGGGCVLCENRVTEPTGNAACNCLSPCRRQYWSARK